jgi:Tfp pilus assembly PilM family ATPase
VAASLTTANVTDRAAVAFALRTAFGRLGARPARVGLVIPDVAARVSLVRFEHVPPRRDDLSQLVRWQLRKSAPFPIDDACVTYTAGARGADGSAEFVAVMARRDVVQEYERACAEAGCHAGIVDIATLSVVNLFLGSGRAPAGDWLAVYMRPEYTSLAIMRDEDVIFFRNRPAGDEESVADLVHQTAMYYQDRLAGQGFTRALLGGSGRAPGAVEGARRSLEERLGTPVEQIDPTTIVPLSDRIGATPELMDALAPLAGMLLRTQAARPPQRKAVGA